MKATTIYATVHDFLDHWDGVRMVTLKLLECFDDSDLGYRLVREWRTVGELFHHLGAHQFYGCRGILLGRWDASEGEPDEDWEAHKAVDGSIGSARLSVWLSSVQHQVHEWLEEAEEGALNDLRPDNPWFRGDARLASISPRLSGRASSPGSALRGRSSCSAKHPLKSLLKSTQTTGNRERVDDGSSLVFRRIDQHRQHPDRQVRPVFGEDRFYRYTTAHLHLL